MLSQKPHLSNESLGDVAWPPITVPSLEAGRFDATPSAAPRTMGIVGAGMMGVAVAAASVKRNVKVVITDSDVLAQAGACDRIAAELAQHGDMANDRISPTVQRQVIATDDPAVVAQCDLVLESVPENLRLKQAIYAQVEPRLGARSILASNTSTIPIARLAAELADPERFCGIHFFHPVRHRPLVEIIRGPKTSENTVAIAMAYARAIAKMPIVVDDGPGFLVNRLLVPYLTEALEILLDGATIEQVEQAATQFGMALGPLRLLDQIGVDTVLLAGRVLWEAFPERVIASPLLVTLYKSGRRGRKTGAGFFCYPSGENDPGQPDPKVDAILAQWARAPQRFTQEEITARLLLPMILEASRLLEEGKVRDPQAIDLAMVHGLGFPAGRGGLLQWADTLGAERILQRLEPLASLGARMQPTRLLLEMARQRRAFYPVSRALGQTA